MKKLSATQLDSIYNFFESIELEYLNLQDFINQADLNNLDFENAFDDIYQILEDCEAFDIEITYYKTAMYYLSTHDASLRYSMGIASEHGYTCDKINSELLASLLASEITREAFESHKEEINDFFSNI